MSDGTIQNLLSLLGRLKVANIFYSLSDQTENAVMVHVAVPGERWEVEFHNNGEVGIEIFVSKGEIQDAASLDDLFTRFSN